VRVAIRIPWALIALRVLLAPLLAWLVVRQHLQLAALLSVIAVLSDILDGVIARRLGVATLRLRLADSVADIWLYGWLGLGIVLGLADLAAPLAVPFAVVTVLQAASWGFCLLRFRRWSSYHSLLSKLTGLLLGVGVLGLLLSGTHLAMAAALWVFALAAAEEIAMTAVLRRYHHDVRHLPAALRLRRQDRSAIATDG